MDFKELRSLATISRTGNISHAGKLLHLTPSAIHRQLKLLSQDLGIALYERQGSSLTLTPAARNLLPLIEDLLVQFDSIVSAARDWGELRRGSVRIGAGPTFSSYVLPSFLEAFRSRYPQLEIFLEAGHTTQLLADLADGSIDLVFLVLQPGIRKNFTVEASWPFEVPMVASPRFAMPRRTSLKKAAGYPFLLYKRGSYFEDQIDRYFTQRGVTPRVSMRLDNAEPIKALVRSGFGVSLLPEWAIRRELEAGELIKIELREGPMRSVLSLARRRGKYVPGPTAALIQMAREWNWRSARPGTI
jgi:DNA-binding transcriptional LysR family regulator